MDYATLLSEVSADETAAKAAKTAYDIISGTIEADYAAAFPVYQKAVQYYYDNDLITCIQFCQKAINLFGDKALLSLDFFAYCAVAAKDLGRDVAASIFKSYLVVYDKYKRGDLENTLGVSFLTEDYAEHKRLCEKLGRFGVEEPWQLVIGMIVKDEAKKQLKLCLDSLQPILKATRSKLVITDTGSTDNTVEIAKKYTEYVNTFEWINNYAAARNANLAYIRQIAKDEGHAPVWYMFVDADEVFSSNVSDIVNFFTDLNKNYQYSFGSYLWHNLNNSIMLNDYTIFRPLRIARFGDNVIFSGKIHETFDVVIAPYVYLNSYANHYGYVITDEHAYWQKNFKYDRLLREELAELKENLPKVIAEGDKEKIDLAKLAMLRVYEHLLHAEFAHTDDIKSFYKEMFEVMREHPDFHYSYPTLVDFQKTIIRASGNFGMSLDLKTMYEEANQYYAEFVEPNNDPRQKLIHDFNSLMFWQSVGEPQTALKHIKGYLNGFKTVVREKKSDFNFIESFSTIRANKEEAYTNVRRDLTAYLGYTDNAEEAVDTYRKIFVDTDNVDKMKKAIEQIADITHYTGNYSFAEKCLDLIPQLDKTENALDVLEFQLSEQLRKNPDNFLEKFGLERKGEALFYKYVDVLRGGKYEDIISFLDNVTSLAKAENYSDIFYAALRSGKPFLDKIPKSLDKNDIYALAIKISEYRSDFPELVEQYINPEELATLPELGYAAEFLFAAAIAAANRTPSDTNTELYKNLFGKYAASTAYFAENAYSETALSDITALIPRERLGILAELYYTAENEGDKAEYKTEITEVAKYFPLNELREKLTVITTAI
ncbi:MAG: glycosyltransferase family 2 protein [Oscillospiraceae bacterium]|jgi:glycosyltransferase involved in cell wall biosynthesis|nr:glycosyltransferase family 2 protein [Oscillospiraceae bacterium]